MRYPIERIDGKILDGRRRFRACVAAGVDPQFKDVAPADPVAYVLSLNLLRRQLDESQKAMVGARARDIYDRMAKERQMTAGAIGGRASGATRRGETKVQDNCPEPSEESGQARDAAGKAVGVSGKSIDRARTVLTKGTPELVKAVDTGAIKVSRAAKIAKESPAVQKKAVEEATAPKPKTKGKGSKKRKSSKVTAPPATDAAWSGLHLRQTG